MRIAVLCNDRLGIPALQQLVQNRLVVAAGTSDRVPEMIGLMQQMSAQSGVPCEIFSRQGLESALASWLLLHKPDVVLVKTFPYKIPSSVLNIPKHGFINFHYAPLPAFRGSNPLFWMIKEQVATGGVCVHQMDNTFDTGSILFQKDMPMRAGITFGMCSTQLAYAGMELTSTLLQSLHAGNLKPIPQKSSNQRWYGRPAIQDFTINWNTMNAARVIALANACNPWLKGAVTKGNGWTFGITDASLSLVQLPENTLPGTILALDENNGLVVACADKTTVRVDVFYCEEGFYPGQRLVQFGFKTGQRLG